MFWLRGSVLGLLVEDRDRQSGAGGTLARLRRARKSVSLESPNAGKSANNRVRVGVVTR